jgi:hypothetical protein
VVSRRSLRHFLFGFAFSLSSPSDSDSVLSLESQVRRPSVDMDCARIDSPPFLSNSAFCYNWSELTWFVSDRHKLTNRLFPFCSSDSSSASRLSSEARSNKAAIVMPVDVVISRAILLPAADSGSFRKLGPVSAR